ncbi:hypothetical protein BOX15_Mlig023379g1 [Macrostomum lignano]|uniref:Uncharacterized protein n=1 Tax=Macrostomum lignano TaxID=282301 RepID=A0A267G588_9PLAT|nr:hypothetical protein BOX15_Mlig023379g1 [Macrostomum lignano]
MLIANSTVPSRPQSAKCIEYFLHLGAQSDTTDADGNTTDADGNTAAHLAARRGRLRLLTLLPFRVKFLRNQTDDSTPLMEAAECGQIDCAKHLLHLLRSGSKRSIRRQLLLEARNRRGQTALDLARCCGHEDLAAIIQIEMRLSISGFWIFGQIVGLTAEETATQQQLANLVRSNDLAGLQQVATRVNCDLPDAYGQTALMLAASRLGPDGSAPLVEFLVRSVDADVSCADLMGETSLHRVATEAGARILIEAGAPVNAATKLVGLTPLMRAAMLDNNDDNENSSLENNGNQGDVVVRQLICLGVADWSRRDSFGCCAIDWARRMRRRKTVDYLSGFTQRRCLCTNQLPYFDQAQQMPELLQLNMEDPPAVKDGI